MCNEDNKEVFMDKMASLNLEDLSSKELEYIIHYYCIKFLKYSEKAIERLFEAKEKNTDQDILNKINEFLEKINKCKAMSKVVIKRRSIEEKEEEADNKAKALNIKYIKYISKLETIGKI